MTIVVAGNEGSLHNEMALLWLLSYLFSAILGLVPEEDHEAAADLKRDATVQDPGLVLGQGTMTVIEAVLVAAANPGIAAEVLAGVEVGASQGMQRIMERNTLRLMMNKLQGLPVQGTCVMALPTGISLLPPGKMTCGPVVLLLPGMKWMNKQ